jgi:hypothetical protein
MKYKIIHPESDAEWIEDNPSEELLRYFENNDCSIIKIEDKE